jgi:hypothetical protein
MASPPSFKIWPTDLFLPMAVNFFLMILVLIAKGTRVNAVYLQDATLTAVYRRIIEIKGVSLFYWNFLWHFLQEECCTATVYVNNFCSTLYFITERWQLYLCLSQGQLNTQFYQHKPAVIRWLSNGLAASSGQTWENKFLFASLRIICHPCTCVFFEGWIFGSLLNCNYLKSLILVCSKMCEDDYRLPFFDHL